MSASELAAWLTRLESLHPTEIELGLERVSAVAENLQLLQPGARVITVAGTNGKGSTVAVLDVLARDAGLRTGVFTSPHLLRYNERIRIDGQLASDAEIVSAFSAIDAARDGISLTYFEFGALAALLLFEQAGLDVLILEVGLGGRLDAVNIVDPELAIITSISIDHQDWLGHDRELIGLEKAGILRPGITAILADPDPPDSVLRRIQELGCTATYYDPDCLPLDPGVLRHENLTAAWQAASHMGFAPSLQRLQALLPDIHCPGRLQQMQVAGRELVFDVAHNPAAVANLAAWLEAQTRRPRIAVFAALSDKDIHAMIRACWGCFDGWFLSGLPGVARAIPPDDLEAVSGELRALGSEADVLICDDPGHTWQQVLDGTSVGDTVVVFGSFLTVAAFMQVLREERS